MTLTVFLRHLARIDAFGRHYRLALEAGRFLKSAHPTLESEAIDEKDLGFGDSLGVGRRRLKDVGIDVRADEGRDVDPVTPDLTHHVAENAERGDDFDLIRCRRAARRDEE